MVNDKDKITVYFETVVNKVYKILPLFEEENEGLPVYIDSLLFELYGLEKVISIDKSGDYLSLLSTLESIKYKILRKDIVQTVLKREVFKCLNIVKNMIAKLEKE